MGMAHALSLPGSLDVLVDVLGSRPLLEPRHVAWLGIDDRFATEWEHAEARRLELHVISSSAFADDPVSSAVSSLNHLPPGPWAVHLDVDVLDFTDAPLAENTDGAIPDRPSTRLRSRSGSRPRTRVFGPCRSES